MDVMLQHHRAKHVCDIPDGLRELCADISREVIRYNPDDIYCFIADYLDALLITRENAKVAIKIVQNVTLKSEHIVEILVGTGLGLDKIAAVAPRLQKAFKVYLNAVDEQKKECGCDVDSDVDDDNEISICQILRATGACYPDAQRAAIKIQALFRGHHERMSLAEARGEVQWQRAAANTVELLRKSGVTRAEATRAAIIIQAAYRGYYTRKNLKIRRGRDGKEKKESVDMCEWYRMMYEETGVTPHRLNQAAIVIQRAYRQYRQKISGDDLLFPSETPRKLEPKEDSAAEGSPVAVESEVKSEPRSEPEVADLEDEADAEEACEVNEESTDVDKVEETGSGDQVVDEAEDEELKEYEDVEDAEGVEE